MHAKLLPTGLTASSWIRDRSIELQTARDRLDRPDSTGGAVGIVTKAASGAPHKYVEFMLPRMANLIQASAKPREDNLDSDLLWSYRSFGDHVRDGRAVRRFSKGTEWLAGSDPALLDHTLSPIQDRPHDAIAYWYCALTAPKQYPDRIIAYLIADPLRLKIGYSTSGGGRSPTIYVSARAVEAAS